MKKGLGLLAVLLVVLFVVGCTTTTPYFYSDNSAKDYTILGEVTYTATYNVGLFGLYGGGGFQNLLDAAKESYPDVDYVVDVTIDKVVEKSGNFSKQSFKMRGKAIKYK
ncbi:hypothetical protein LQZ19_02300 [Treponema primitia]|uniref:hypothetical protein n=1 Tax=Treponema primitia TaxID=88058 RepID=UPI0039807811